MPTAEHVVGPHAHADEHDRHRGGGHEFVAEQHLARKHRNHFRNHAEGRQNENVNLGMAEKPKQMLPQIGRAAVLRIEEMRPQQRGRIRPSTSAAVSGGMASRICTLVQNMVQVKNGTLPSVMPGQRIVQRWWRRNSRRRRSCRCR